MIHPQFNPVAIKIPLGFTELSVHWYGLMYLLAFLMFYGLGRVRIKSAGKVSVELLDDLLFYGAMGVILGGRLGYVLFYKPGYYLQHPLEIFAVWQGGMSFHGGFMGVMLATWLVARKYKLHWFVVTDFIAPLSPTGLAAGRMGNFINGELWGRVTAAGAPWAMIFPQAGDGLPRHPSQLYQFALEGSLFFILWFYTAKPRPLGAASGLFLAGYGLTRFIVEFAREPDSFLGLLWFGWSMGQWLSVPMIVGGIGLVVWSYRADKRA
jgi:phosphatidylglycerol:prolipoprotein diacylglycerol transferase